MGVADTVSGSRDKPDTRASLLNAAESLFASNGIDNTSVREVNQLAAQRNTSAIRYHFGGMPGLLEALIEERMSALDRARSVALTRLENESDTQRLGVHALAGVLLHPLIDRAETNESWACWARVLSQLISVRGQEHRVLWEGRFDQTTRRVFAVMRKQAPAMPAVLWQQRVSDSMLFTTGSICERVERRSQPDAKRGLSAARYRENLIQTATAILLAPV